MICLFILFILDFLTAFKGIIADPSRSDLVCFDAVFVKLALVMIAELFLEAVVMLVNLCTKI